MEMPPFRRERRPQVSELPWIEVSCGGEFPLEVHGESFHQAALRSLVQSHRPEIVDDRIIATFMVGLMREPTNPYDADAVAVVSLTGEQLGHVPRELAGACSRALLSSQQHCSVGCQARAYGRRIRRRLEHRDLASVARRGGFGLRTGPSHYGSDRRHARRGSC